MKKKIPLDLKPQKKKNYLCSVCTRKNKSLARIVSVYKDCSFPNFKYLMCSNCNSLYLSDDFSDQLLANLHDKYYENFENFSFNYFKSIKRTEVNRSTEWYNYYKNKIRKQSNNKKLSLDIGSGWGGCTDAFRKIGFNAYGIDPQSQCISYSKKKFKKSNFFLGTLDEFQKKKKLKFDVITLHDVLEHIGNPKKLVYTISKCMKKNGLLFIKVPNSESLQIEYLKEFAWEISPPFHRTLFSKKGLKLLLNKNKFDITEYYNDSNSWGWTRGMSSKHKIEKNYEGLRKNKSFRKLDLEIDLLFENISKNLEKPTILFLKAKKL